ncbi:hypothetical protein [Microbacterium sp. LWO13-1.2]|uniref:hypothetical protein n=1 Tax=Microbacterium sp. LWO13-1.2 TaxID=3135262 RepID=UPI0031388B63
MTDALHPAHSATSTNLRAAVFVWISALGPAILAWYSLTAGFSMLGAEGLSGAFAHVPLALGVLAVVLVAATIYLGVLAHRGSRIALVWSIIFAALQVLIPIFLAPMPLSAALDPAFGGDRSAYLLVGFGPIVSAVLAIIAVIIIARSRKTPART